MFSIWPVLFTGVGATLLIQVTRSLSYKYSPSGQLPRAPRSESSWWLGHEWSIKSNPWGVKYLRWTGLLGPIYRIKSALWRQDIIIVSDHLAVKHIFDNAYTYIKSPAFSDLFVRFVGKGIVWADGDNHKWQRRMVSPAFSPQAIRKMAPAVMLSTEKMVSRIQGMCDGQATVVNIGGQLSACTLDIIGRVGFGLDFGPDTPEGKAIIEAWHSDTAMFRTFAAFLSPIVIEVFPTAKKVITQVGTRLLREQPNTDGTDIFSILVRESWEGKQRPDGVRRLDDSTLVDNILSFFIAGFETTATTCMYIVHDLAKNPDIQQKLRAEISGINISNVEEIENLPLLDAITREGLRLHPTVLDASRVATQDDILPLRRPLTLPNGQIVHSIPIQAGQTFVVSYQAINTDPAVWGPDADQFRPERWMIPGALPAKDQLPFGPFSNVSNFTDGPRVCIGWRLAIQEIKVMLTYLVSTFDIQDTGANIIKYSVPGAEPFVDGVGEARLPVRMIPL
ncbi:cytochrome P450 [Flagelloscypha sp. PMI_526]|nr:cytochrome P450 [Flagelloscypha sp. PMI_526]